MQYSDRNCTSSRTRGKWPEVAAAPTAIKDGMGEEDVGGDTGGAAGVEGGGERGLVV